MIDHALERRPWIAPLLVMLLALGLYLTGLGARSLWFDEAMSVRVAHLPRDEFLRWVGGQELFTGLYYVILRGWTKLGDSEFLVRLPSVAFAVGAVGFTYLAGRRLLGARAALAGAAVLAGHALLLQYAQEARTYAPAIMFTVAASWALLVAIDLRRPRWWALYTVLLVAAVYAHFFAVMVAVGHAAAVLLLSDRRSVVWRPAMLAWAAAAAASLPLGTWLLLNDQTRGWIPALSPARLLAIFQWLGGGNAVSAAPWSTALSVIALAVIALGAVAGLLALRRHDASAWPWAFLLAWVLMPIVGGLIGSIVVKPILADRYMIVVLPAFALLVGGLWSRISRPALQLMVAIVVVAVLAFGTLQVYGSEMKKPQWREAVATIASAAERGDAVIVEPGWQWVPLSYALHQAGASDLVDRVVTNPDVEDPAMAIQAAAAQHPRVWLLVVDGREVPASTSYQFLDLLEERYREVSHTYVHRIGIYLFERAP